MLLYPELLVPSEYTSRQMLSTLEDGLLRSPHHTRSRRHVRSTTSALSHRNSIAIHYVRRCDISLPDPVSYAAPRRAQRSHCSWCWYHNSRHIPSHSALDRMTRQLPEGLHCVTHPISPFHSSALGLCRPGLARPSLHSVDQPPTAIRTQSAAASDDSASCHLSTIPAIAVLWCRRRDV